MHDVLAQIVALEAKKLLSTAEGNEPLESERLDALEKLCRCAKALKVDEAEADSLAMDDDVEAALALVDKTR